MKAWLFTILMAGVLLVGLAPSTNESAAQEEPGKAAPDSAVTSRFATNSPGDAREVEGFFGELIRGQLREENVAGATATVVKDGRIIFAKGYHDAMKGVHDGPEQDKTQK